MNNEGYIKKKIKFFKHIRIIRSIQETIQFIEGKLDNNDISLEEWHDLIGQVEALKDIYNKSIKDIFEVIKKKKEEIKSLMNDTELFEMHIQFLKGYIKGCEKILHFHREYKESDETIKTLVYVQEDALKEILIILFESAGMIFDNTLSEQNAVFISTDIEKLNQLSSSVQCNKYVFVVEPLQNRSFNVSEEETQNINMLKDQLSDKYEFQKKKDDNLITNLRLLNEEWSEASYVFITSLMSIEQIFMIMIKSLKVF